MIKIYFSFRTNPYIKKNKIIITANLIEETISAGENVVIRNPIEINTKTGIWVEIGLDCCNLISKNFFLNINKGTLSMPNPDFL